MSTETWKPVVGREGEYEVSDLGRVRSVARAVTQAGRWGGVVERWLAGGLIKTQKHTNGYLFVVLGRDRYYSVHRLVATAFTPGASDGLQVNHKNSVRDDNKAVNLEWVTCGDNHKHAHRKQGRKKHIWTTAVTLIKAEESVPFVSQLAAANYLGVTVGSISSALRRSHKCRGYEVRA